MPPLPRATGFSFDNGEPGKAPVRPNISLGDTVRDNPRGIGRVAIIERNKSGKGQVVSVALYQSIFNLSRGIRPKVRRRRRRSRPIGTTITGIVPTNTYLCSDDKRSNRWQWRFHL